MASPAPTPLLAPCPLPPLLAGRALGPGGGHGVLRTPRQQCRLGRPGRPSLPSLCPHPRPARPGASALLCPSRQRPRVPILHGTQRAPDSEQRLRWPTARLGLPSATLPSGGGTPPGSTEKTLCRWNLPAPDVRLQNRMAQTRFLHSSHPQGPQKAGERADRPAASRLETQTPSSPPHAGLGRGACTPHGHQTAPRQTAGEAALGPKDGSGQAQPRAGPLRSAPHSTAEPSVSPPRAAQSPGPAEVCEDTNTQTPGPPPACPTRGWALATTDRMTLLSRQPKRPRYVGKSCFI